MGQALCWACPDAPHKESMRELCHSHHHRGTWVWEVKCRPKAPWWTPPSPTPGSDHSGNDHSCGLDQRRWGSLTSLTRSRALSVLSHCWHLTPGTRLPTGVPALDFNSHGGDTNLLVTVIWTKWNKKRYVGLPWWLSGKEPACQCRRHRFNPWSGKMPRSNEAHVSQVWSL